MVYDCVLYGIPAENERSETVLEIGDVAFDGLRPLLTPTLLWEPTGIGAEVDELLVD